MSDTRTRIAAPSLGPFGRVLLTRTQAPAGESCECGTILNRGEACYVYDIGGGVAFACVPCRIESVRIGLAEVVK